MASEAEVEVEADAALAQPSEEAAETTTTPAVHTDPIPNTEPSTTEAPTNGNGTQNGVEDSLSDHTPQGSPPVTPNPKDDHDVLEPEPKVQKSNSAAVLTQASTAGTKDDCTLFCLRAFKQITPLLSKKLALLKEAMQSVLAMLDNTNEMPLTMQRPVGMGDGKGGVKVAKPLQVFVYLLRGACECGDTRVVPLALDGMQKLMSFSDVSDDMEGSLSLVAFSKRAKVKIPEGDPATHPWRGKKVGLLAEVVTAICSTSSFSSTTPLSDEVTLQTSKALLTAVTEKNVHGKALRLAVSMVFQLTIKSTTPKSIATSKATLTQIVNHVFSALEMTDDEASIASSPPSPTGDAVPHSSILQKHVEGSADKETKHVEFSSVDPETGLATEQSDAAYLINYLAGILETVDLTELTPQDAPEMKMGLGSLEILQRIVKSSCLAFKTHYAFLNAIRNKLFAVTIRCITSPVQQVLQVGLGIFKSLVMNMKHHFKEEICHVFIQVLLKVLSSGNASYEQKSLILQLFVNLFQTPQLFMDIFVNYDCDLNQENLYSILVENIASLVLAHQAEPDWVTPRQNHMLKLLALQAVLSMLRSFDIWIKNHETSQKPAPSSQVYSGRCSYVECTKRKKLKDVLQEASQLLLEKPKKGIKCLQTHGVLMEKDEDAPGPYYQQVAQIFETYKRLDRQAVGDYIGDENQTPILKEFCALSDFTGLTLDEAIRVFLSRFALPKEGQKIERVMEFFSEAFYNNNKSDGECESVDAVFVLAVGIVMLNTDLHNPRVNNKISLEKFTKQFSGVNNGKDFRPEYLATLYNNIKTNAMKDYTNAYSGGDTAEDTQATGLFYSAFTSRREKKAALYHSESNRIATHCAHLIGCVAKSTEHQEELPLVEGPPKKPVEFYQPTDIEHARPMMEEIWACALAAISHLFDSTDAVNGKTSVPANTPDMSQDVIKLCMEGITRAVHITCSFDLHQVRDSFVLSLCAMTGAQEKIRLVSYKNIAATKTLLKVPIQNGDSLNSSWIQVFRTISDIEAYRALGLRLKKNTDIQSKEIGGPSLNEQHNARMFYSSIDEESISRLIAHSTQISQAGLKELIQHLCSICVQDINGREGRAVDTPRKFLLEKVVEVASDNMGSRLLAIWPDLSRLFVTVGTQSNAEIAEYGVDSLRQLVLKSISHVELQSCQIQPELLSPFLDIMSSSLPCKSVRELILHCLKQLVRGQCSHIGPGFPILLKTLISGVHKHKEVEALKMTREIVEDTIQGENIVYMLNYLEDLVYCVTYVACDTKLDPEGSVAFSSNVLFHLPAKVRGCGAPNTDELYQKTWGYIFECFIFLSLDMDDVGRKKNVAALKDALINLSHDANETTEAVWEVYSTVFLSTLLLYPTLTPYIILNTTASYAHYRYFNVPGTVERLSHKDWLQHALPSLISSIVVDVGKANSENAHYVKFVPNIVAVLCRLCRTNTIREVHLAIKGLDVLVEALCPHFGAQEWDQITQHLLHLFKRSLIRTTLFKPHYEGSGAECDDTADPTNDHCTTSYDVTFPGSYDLCPEQFRVNAVSPRVEVESMENSTNSSTKIPIVRTPSLMIRGEGSSKTVRKVPPHTHPKKVRYFIFDFFFTPLFDTLLNSIFLTGIRRRLWRMGFHALHAGGIFSFFLFVYTRTLTIFANNQTIFFLLISTSGYGGQLL